MSSGERYDSLFRYYGQVYSVDWRLLKAQARAESRLDSNAVSRVGAKGLTQFMDPTFKEWSEKLKLVNPNPFNPEQSIQLQAAYMEWLIRQGRGDLKFALAAYNAGIGRMQSLLRQHGDVATAIANSPAETRSYVAKIMETYAKG